MPRRPPDDLVAALEALSPDDLRNAARDLASNDAHIADAQDLAHALALGPDPDFAVVLDRAFGLDRSFDLARPLGLEQALGRAIRLGVDRPYGLGAVPPFGTELDRAFGLALALDRVRELDVDRAFGRGLSFDLDRAFDRLGGLSARAQLEERGTELGVSPKALWGSLLIQRWWHLIVVVWAVSLDEPGERNPGFSHDEADRFSHDEADRARRQLEAVEGTWQNIELDPQIELDPGDEEFIHAQLTTIRSQLILDGIPEIIAGRATRTLCGPSLPRTDHSGAARRP